MLCSKFDINLVIRVSCFLYKYYFLIYFIKHVTVSMAILYWDFWTTSFVLESSFYWAYFICCTYHSFCWKKIVVFPNSQCSTIIYSRKSSIDWLEYHELYISVFVHKKSMVKALLLLSKIIHFFGRRIFSASLFLDDLRWLSGISCGWKMREQVVMS